MSLDQPLPSPWNKFLTEVDGMLSEQLDLHCVGGFVVAYFYGAPGYLKHIRLLVLDPYDCILSKVERNVDVDVNDAEYLFRSQKLDAQMLRERYQKESRPYIIGDVATHDTTMKLWLEIFTAERG